VAAVLLASWLYLYTVHVESITPGLIRQIDRKSIVPKFWIEVIGFTAVGIAILGVALRTWRRSAPVLLQETAVALRAAPGPDGPAGRRRALAAAAKEIAGGGMRDCEDFQQWLAHVLAMWGFVGLFITTSLDTIVNRPADPLTLLHPVRLLGNVSGIMFVTGLTLAIARRASLPAVRAASTRSDWTFLLSLWGTGVSGFAVQWYADLGNRRGTAWSYIVHLVFIGLIIAAAPWTKFIHAVWRPTWVLYRSLLAERRG
jgi:hypothetical protein